MNIAARLQDLSGVAKDIKRTYNQEYKESTVNMDGNMELAKVSQNGQVTIPIAIRRRLNLKGGDKLLFFEQEGRIFIDNPGNSEQAFRKMQAIFKASDQSGSNCGEDGPKSGDSLR